MGEIAKLPNIGPVVEEQLKQVGITTYEQLKAARRSGFLHMEPLC